MTSQLTGSTSIDDLQVSVRCKQCLEHIQREYGVGVLAQLATLKVSELKKVPNCGPKMVRELAALLKAGGLPGFRAEDAASRPVSAVVTLKAENERLRKLVVDMTFERGRLEGVIRAAYFDLFRGQAFTGYEAALKEILLKKVLP